MSYSGFSNGESIAIGFSIFLLAVILVVTTILILVTLKMFCPRSRQRTSKWYSTPLRDLHHKTPEVLIEYHHKELLRSNLTFHKQIGEWFINQYEAPWYISAFALVIRQRFQ